MSNKSVQKIIFFATFITLLLVFFLTKNLNYNVKSYFNSNQSRNAITNSNLFKNYSSLNKDKWIVVTSVNDPTDQIKYLSKIDKFQLLVVGDIKTNKNWKWDNVIYLSINDQENLNYNSFKTVPFNSYARKNIGYLYAIQNGAKYIYDTDDDNKPIVNLTEYFNFENYDYGLIFDKNSPRVLNPYAHFGQPLIWPRGYPLSEIKNPHYNNYICTKRKTSLVQQGVVNGDPDVDAIFRLTKSLNYKKIDIKFDETSPSIQYPINKFSPYNSQNTLFSYEALWSLYLPKTISFRLTDIWRSYWAQRLIWMLDGTVTFNGPNAYQLRNSHSYLKDFYEEQDMYLKTEKLIDFLFEWKCNEITFYACVINLSEEMVKKGFWLAEEVISIKNWLDDLTSIGYIEPIMKIQSNFSTVDYFPVRYTPKFQKSIDFDNYWSNNVSNSLNELYDNFKSIQYLEDFCKLSNANLTYKTSLIDSKAKYSNLTLLITFNREIRPMNIELIRHMYGDFFKNIIFCGLNIFEALKETKSEFKKFDSYTFIEIDTNSGNFHYYCMTKVIEMNFVNVQGILLASDDILIKYWHFDTLNISKIWFPEKIECNYELESNKDSGWMWWGTHMGKPAFKNLFEHFKKIKNLTIPMERKYVELILDYERLAEMNSIKAPNSNNTIICFHMGSDIFYLPQSKFKSFHFISSLFRQFQVFLELGLPAILSGLDMNKNMEILNGTYDWVRSQSYNFDNYDKMGFFFHPTKLSQYKASPLGQRFCNVFIQDKLNHSG